jgi:hypothetical protein
MSVAKQPAPITPEGSGMALSSRQPIPHPGPAAPVPSAEDEVRAARHVFGRWTQVPSRELRRIRQILLQAGEAASGDDLPVSVQDLLEQVTAELLRRGHLSSHLPSAPRRSDHEGAPSAPTQSQDGQTALNQSDHARAHARA